MSQRKPYDSKVTKRHSNLPGQLPAAADLSFMGLMFYNHLYPKQVIEKTFWVFLTIVLATRIPILVFSGLYTINISFSNNTARIK